MAMVQITFRYKKFVPYWHKIRQPLRNEILNNGMRPQMSFYCETPSMKYAHILNW